MGTLVTASFNQDINSVLIKNIEYSGSDPVYIGLADPGTANSTAGWRLTKLTFDGSGNATSVRFANGDPSQVYVWDDRASYDYS